MFYLYHCCFIGVWTGIYTHYVMSENSYQDKIKPYEKQQQKDSATIEALQQNVLALENKQVELEEQAQDKSSNEGLPEEVNATIEGFVKAEYTYTNTQERAENILPFITAEMVPYFQQGETTSDSKNVVKVQSNLTKQEIGHYFLEDEKCQVTVRAWSAFQVDNQKKTENQVLLDLELVKIETGKWFIDSQEIATIQ